MRARQFIQPIAVALLIAAAQPVAAEQVPVRTERNGESRLITFAWRSPVAYEQRIADGRLVINFSTPIEGPLQSIVGSFGDLLTDVRRSADGRSVSFGLRRPVEAYAFYSGTAVTVELLPKGGPAAAPPAAEPQPATPAAAPAGSPSAPVDAARVAVRTGRHQDYTRVVFDFPRNVAYTISNDGGVVRMRFKSPADIDVGVLNGGGLPLIGGARTEISGGETIVTMAIPPTSTVRDFLSGPKVVIDVRRPSGSATAAALPPPDAPTAQAAAPSQPQPEAAASEPVTPVEQAELPPQAPPPAEPATAAPTNRPRALTPTGAAPPPSPAASGDEQLSPRALAQSNGPLGAAKASATPGAEDVAFRFEFDEPVAAAAFRHGGAVWMVFDKPLTVDTAALKVQAGNQAIDLEQLPNPNATVLRLRTSRRYNPAVSRDGLSWIIDLRERDMAPQTALTVDAQPTSPVGARVFIAVPEPGRPISIADPNVGVNFIVVPLIPLGHAIGREFSYPQFSLDVAAQGIVINPVIDDLRVRSLRQGVEISSSGVRLAISNVSDDAAAHAQLASSRPMSLALEDLSNEFAPVDQFRVVRREKELAVSEAPPRTRTAARMELARFFFANGYAPETLGVLEVAKESVPLLENDPAFRVLRGGANFMLGRYQDALADLTNESLQGNDEGRLWAAATTAMMGDRIGSARDLRFTGGIARDYPRKLKMDLGILIAEVAAETGDGQGARLFLDALNLENPTPDEQAMLRFAEGKLKELDGDYEAAVQLWDDVIASDHRPSRARARAALTEMLLKLRRISERDAIEQYEKLRFAWRGDRREFENLRRLGSLYLDEGFFREGLQTLKEAATNFREYPEATDVTKQMSDTFNALFLGDAADQLDPVKAIAVYNEFKELTPTGARGDEMIRNLADKLVDVDLLDRAAELLSAQVQFRLQGEQKARVGARLALIHTFAREYQKALEVLEGTGQANLPDELSAQRRHLLGKVLFGLGRNSEALALLENDQSEAAELIRHEIYWNTGDWRSAANSLRLLVKISGAEPGMPLTDKQAARISNYAVALTNSGGERVLSQLKRKFAPAIAQTKYAEMFQLVTAPSQIGVIDPLAVSRKVQEAETFLSAYRNKLKDGEPLSSIN